MVSGLQGVGRRAVLRGAAVAGAAGLVAGCNDEAPSGTGTPSAQASGGATPSEKPGEQPTDAPSQDPAAVAALSLAATQVAQLSLRYGSISQAYPGLRKVLAAGVQSHAAHFAELKKVAGVEPARPGKLPAVPKTTAAALADLVAREQRLAVTHSVEAAKLSGPPARLLAMLAASETQLANALDPARKASR